MSKYPVFDFRVLRSVAWVTSRNPTKWSCSNIRNGGRVKSIWTHSKETLGRPSRGCGPWYNIPHDLLACKYWQTCFRALLKSFGKLGQETNCRHRSACAAHFDNSSTPKMLKAGIPNALYFHILFCMHVISRENTTTRLLPHGTIYYDVFFYYRFSSVWCVPNHWIAQHWFKDCFTKITPLIECAVEIYGFNWLILMAWPLYPQFQIAAHHLAMVHQSKHC